MVFYFIQVYVLLLFPLQANAAACTEGYFGPGCKYKCRCAQSVSCDYHGVCQVACEKNYFGKGCQFVNIISGIADESVPLYLLDDNDTTCNPYTDETSIAILLNKRVTLSWFRIVVNKPVDLTNFKIRVNDGEPCHLERKFIVNNLTVDVTCQMHETLSTLHIIGDIAPFVCSIYISLGRNLAINEVTLQSSTFNSDPDQFGSQKAVDDIGDLGDILNSTCSQTEVEESGPWWKINFTLPVVLYFVRVYNRAHGSAFRLNEFLLTMYAKNGTEIKVYRAGINFIVQRFHILTTTAVSYMIIEQSRNFPVTDRYLTLCEFEAFGDYICPEGKYGLFCERNCSCNITEICNAIHGICAQACPPGFYGLTCSYRCSNHCVSDQCGYISGDCFPCRDGYQGVKCNIECKSGSFGPLCRGICSDGCQRPCNHTTGHCPCLSGFIGSLCKECESSRYGPLCELKCPSTCMNGNCHKATGICLLCKPEFIGVMCEDCVKTYYGPHCNNTCSVNCENGTCEREAGKCRKCINDFNGDDCTECPKNRYGERCDLTCSANCLNNKCERYSGNCSACQSGYTGVTCEVTAGTSPYWLLMLLLVLFVFVAICYMERKDKRKSSHNEDNAHVSE